ncbi:hypothetical protein OIE71_28180 [Streptomyces sp. NBC_01725]
MALVGAAVTGPRPVTNTPAVTGAPGNRGGAASLALSARLFGGAPAAPVRPPVYHAYGDLGFAAAEGAPPVVAPAVLVTSARSASGTARTGPRPV